METLHNVALGFDTALTFANLGYCIIGVLLGAVCGAVPGLGPIAAIAMLLPSTMSLAPISSLILLAGIHYGAQYGASTAAILANLPAEPSSVITAIDGYQLARQGHAGRALAAAAIASFVAGTASTFLCAMFAAPLAALTLKFGPPEYFSLMVLGISASVMLAQGSLLNAAGMTSVGLLLGLIGTDAGSGVPRYTFGIPQLADGIHFAVLAMGTFGLGHIISNLQAQDARPMLMKTVAGRMPAGEDIRRMAPPIMRGTAIGSALGILPGGGAMLASPVAYAIEKKVSRNSREFGHGAIEGVAAPEAARAGAQLSFLTLLALGIPSSPLMALMAGALIIQGAVPGPSMPTEQPALFWGFIASMWIGNFILLALNLPLLGLWARAVRIPCRLLFPALLVFCCIGAFSLRNAEFDIFLMSLFGIFGYLCNRLSMEPVPMLLGYHIGPMMEETLRRTLLLSNNDATVFLQRPVSAAMLVMAAMGLAAAAMANRRKNRR